jgi:FkbM family methyltransferase
MIRGRYRAAAEGLYRAAAEGCAEVVVRVPALEAPFVRLGARVWSSPGVGRFYQSTAYRVARRIRRAGTPFRPLVVCGTSVLLDATEFTTLDLYFGGRVYEAATTEYVSRHLVPGAVFVDVGANHGYFTMLAAARLGAGGRVVAFEPNPAVFAQLVRHVRMNGFESRVTLVPAALSDAPAEAAPLFVSQMPRNSGLSSLTPWAAAIDTGALATAHTIPVRVDTFDNWFAASRLDRIDLVKIDVEGAEARVVSGMRTALASGAVEALICETVWGSPAHEALCKAGYEPRVLDPVGALSNVLYLRRGGARS